MRTSHHPSPLPSDPLTVVSLSPLPPDPAAVISGSPLPKDPIPEAVPAPAGAQ